MLLDELRGRKVAAQMGLPVAGSLAVLLTAKQHGLVHAITPLLDQMIAQGKRISAHLRNQVIVQAGE